MSKGTCKKTERAKRGPSGFCVRISNTAEARRWVRAKMNETIVEIIAAPNLVIAKSLVTRAETFAEVLSGLNQDDKDGKAYATNLITIHTTFRNTVLVNQWVS